jgi:hypothetical protein
VRAVGHPGRGGQHRDPPRRHLARVVGVPVAQACRIVGEHGGDGVGQPPSANPPSARPSASTARGGTPVARTDRGAASVGSIAARTSSATAAISAGVR